jgi:uncharacterized protein (UPF0332 family)
MPKELERILRGCFNPREGRPNLKKVLVNKPGAYQHIDKAHRNLRAMKLMFDNDLFDWTITCGYYAMYHAVLAALLNIGIRASAHYCAIAAFKEFYVEQGKVAPEYMTYVNDHRRRRWPETLG